MSLQLFCASFIFLITVTHADKKMLEQTNVLMIMFDDLRTELSIYNRKHMITPNFERLAARSVIFDQAYCQIAVCNPSRDSLLTGLRPDTVGTYGFQSSFRPHLVIQNYLVRSGYNTAGYGKIAHWETPDPEVWSFDSWENNWYEYQNSERNHMNASTMPDKKPEQEFRDYQFTTRVIDSIRKMHAQPKYFMAAIGFKLPHLAVHLPYKYYEMYKGKNEAWQLSKKELRFPPTSPSVAYRCCADPDFRFMNNEGASQWTESLALGDINMPFTDRMHDELMLGYCGAITFLDVQLGRILDVIDELHLWDNITIVLSADHGMHNGEKGIWEKWTMFDESTRVPLIIAHPLSPFHGQHYRQPVELIDVFPTLLDIVGIASPTSCKAGTVCHPLQGKSLAPVIFGENWKDVYSNKDQGEKSKRRDKKSSASLEKRKKKEKMKTATEIMRRGLLDENNFEEIEDLDMEVIEEQNEVFSNESYSALGDGDSRVLLSIEPSALKMPVLDHAFAITQSWRCAKKAMVAATIPSPGAQHEGPTNQVQLRKNIWRDCDKTQNPADEMSVMGYSMRTMEFRYTIWFHFNRVQAVPIMDIAPFAEELYDHRGETLEDFTHLETVNLVTSHSKAKAFQSTVATLREQLIAFIRQKVIFRGPFKRT